MRISRIVALSVFATGAALPGQAVHAQGSIECGEHAAIDAYVETYREMAAFDGVVLIAEGDEVVYHCAYGDADYRFGTPMEPDARFRIASLSKGFTDAAIGRLVDEGGLSLDDALAKYLPDFPNAERITVRHLVEHTSGVAHTNRLEWMDMREPMPLEAIVDALAEEPLDFEPGTDRGYSNGGYALLAAVLEAATESSYERYVEEWLAGEELPSVGHEAPGEVVPQMAHRYAPGPVYGDRAEARTYVVANRIGGGSLHASALDVWRFFRSAYGGELLESGTTEELFPRPSDGDVRITGRSPGSLAQVYMDFESGLSVVTLSSNSGWPGSFNADIVSIY
ncbi:MAG: serine hydrolase domain-containing protein, partial [Gemmatimonadota bacterium]|nr:serine hydrolase domain-containing protein [Gemmatimonadota bacterium]